MCELLGMNCSAPTDICFPFEGFRKCGGGTAEHKDGWGIAFFRRKGLPCLRRLNLLCLLRPLTGMKSA